ncbi:MAG: pilin [Patescibacteria group bacterium]
MKVHWKRTLFIFLFTLWASGGFLFSSQNSYAAESGVSVIFDALPGVNPKILPLDGRVPVALRVIIRLEQYSAFCGYPSITSFRWSVLAEFSNTADQTFVTKTVSFERTSAVVSREISDTIVIQDTGVGRTEDYTYKLYALIECHDGTNAAESSRVSVTAGSGDTTYTCVAPEGSGYIYACSPANLSTCSDNPKCAGKPCFQIRKSLCGDPAPPPGPTPPPGGPGVPGPTGQPVTFNFEIQNPLKINSFLEFFTTIAVWITNIAIPIAVVLIVYAGILFLTAGAVPANVSRARTILTYVIIGLAVILIGRGFISLIESVLNLGGSTTSPTTTVSPTTSVPAKCDLANPCPSGYVCNRSQACIREPVGQCTLSNPCPSGFICNSQLKCVLDE